VRGRLEKEHQITRSPEFQSMEESLARHLDYDYDDDACGQDWAAEVSA